VWTRVRSSTLYTPCSPGLSTSTFLGAMCETGRDQSVKLDGRYSFRQPAFRRLALPDAGAQASGPMGPSRDEGDGYGYNIWYHKTSGDRSVPPTRSWGTCGRCIVEERQRDCRGFVCRSHDKTPALTRHAAAGPSLRLWHQPRRPPVWRVGSTVGEGDLFGRCNPGLDDGWTRGEDNSQACPGGGPIPCGCRPVKSAAIATATWCSSHARHGIPRHGTRGDM